MVRALLGRGTAVLATGRAVSKAPSAMNGLTFIAADLSNRSDAKRLQEAAGSIDAVVHAAALSAPWGAYAAFHAANVMATEHVLELARTSGARRFVHISTPSVYFRFQDQLDVRETAALPAPVNLYAKTKRKAEELVLDAASLDGFIMRPRGLYGAGDTALLPRLIRAAKQRPLPLLRNGQAATDLTHVSDAAQATLAALDAPPSARGIYNISGGVPLLLKDVIDRVCERSEVTARWRRTSTTAALAAARAMEWVYAFVPSRPEPPITPYGVGLLAFSQTLNIDAARCSLGWTPKIGFDEGLDLTFVRGPLGT